MRSGHRQRSYTQGFTLLELLVGVVMLSVGILSVASLQITTTQSNFAASQRLEAAMLADAAVARMRANSERLGAYAGNTLDGGSQPSGSAPTGCTATMDEASCLSATAAVDLWELTWAAYQSQTLVAPKICISQDATVPGDVRIVVAWQGMVPRGAGEASDLDACGQDVNDPDASDFLQQVVVNTYVTPFNPY